MEKICIADTRNQVDDFAVKEIEKLGYRVKRMTLPFGDFALLDNLSYAIDIKSSSGGLIELCRNVCSNDHQRLKREILKCADWQGELCFLIVNEDGITHIDQIEFWEVPTFKSDIWVDKYKYHDKWLTRKQILEHIHPNNLSAYERKKFKMHKKGDLMTRVNPKTFMKALKTMSKPNHYGNGFTIRFSFCNRENAGKKIIQILEWWQRQKQIQQQNAVKLR